MLKKIKDCTYKEFENNFELNSKNSNYIAIKQGLEASKNYLKTHNIPNNLIPNLMEETYKGILKNINPTVIEAVIEIGDKK